MKGLFSCNLIFIVLLTCCTNDNQSNEIIKDEISIYDKNGIATAYCNYSNDNDCIIYLWNGIPTSYFIENETELYGFNGKFLGWKESGIYYDLNGKIIGFEKNALNIAALPNPIKSIKEILPIKSIKEQQPVRPINSTEWSLEPLDSFFSKGRKL